ncbi:hypothetical protein [Streptomyces sp. ST2-7A]|uniref:hypothetical protein n=1 Tax=Streptomyces sp. ST2-7A TaxID=2907214 RepID=UPI001F3CB07E|nr:hypothetical protein [Streptomyces sp. ST2-7A]MCE7078887.1 hypothetical protein [Streptomyces sp. ST2-7A]
MTDNPPRSEDPPPSESPSPGDASPTPARPTLDELRKQTEALGDVITAHFKKLEGR